MVEFQGEAPHSAPNQNVLDASRFLAKFSSCVIQFHVVFLDFILQKKREQ